MDPLEAIADAQRHREGEALRPLRGMESQAVPGRAGFWIRFAAALIDGLILLLLLWAADIMVFLAFRDVVYRVNHLSDVLVGPLLIVFLAMEMYLAATPGKLILKLRIRNADGSVASARRLLSRFLYKNSHFLLLYAASIVELAVLAWAGTLLGVLIAAGCVFAARESRLAAHDEWAGTAVYSLAKKWTQRGFVPVIEARDKLPLS